MASATKENIVLVDAAGYRKRIRRQSATTKNKLQCRSLTDKFFVETQSARRASDRRAVIVVFGVAV